MRMSPVMLAAAMYACTLCAGPSLAYAESIYVKYRGEVSLKSFDCSDITRSSFINRVCYDRRNEYMLISLNGTFYHYCEIDAGTVSSLLNAPSMGRFYNASIKGNFDCRTNRVPWYPQEPDANTLAAMPGGATPPTAQPTTKALESGPFDGRWSATVGPQGACNFSSILILDVVGTSIVGNATNPLGVFPLSGTVGPNGSGIFKIGSFVGAVRFSGTTFDAHYSNDCGGRFAIGRKRTAGNLN